MPNYPDIQTWKRDKLTKAGLNPDAYDLDPKTGTVTPIADTVAPVAPIQTPDSPVKTAAKSFGWSLPEVAAGLAGAGLAGQGLSAGLDATGVGLPAGIAGHAISGAAMLAGAGLASYATGRAKRALAPSIEANVEASAATNPTAAKVGSYGAQIVGMRPSLGVMRGVGSGLRNLTTERALTAIEKSALANVGAGAGLSGAQDVAGQLVGDQPYSPGQTLEATLAGAALHQPTRLGSALSANFGLTPRGEMTPVPDQHDWTAEGKRVMGGIKRTPTATYGDVNNPAHGIGGEGDLSATDREFGLPRQVGEQYADYMSRLAEARHATRVKATQVKDDKGNPVYGVALPRDSAGNATVEVSPNQFHNTLPHEQLHVVINDIKANGSARDKAMMAQAVKLAGGEEAFVQQGGEAFIRRLNGGDSWWGDVKANWRQRRGTATPEDNASLMANRLTRGASAGPIRDTVRPIAPITAYTDEQQAAEGTAGRPPNAEFQGSSNESPFSTDFEKELGKPRPWNIQVSTKDGRMSANDVRAGVAKLNPAEQELLRAGGIEDYLRTTVRPTAGELKAWAAENLPRVEVKELGAVEDTNKARTAIVDAERDMNAKSHLMETAGFNLHPQLGDRGYVQNREGTEVYARQGDTIYKYRLPATYEGEHSLIPLREIPVSDANRWGLDAVNNYFNARDAYSNIGRHDDFSAATGNDSATRRYDDANINPRALKDMPGAVDLLVKLPHDANPDRDPVKYSSNHYPQSGDNLLAHARAYEHTMPDGERVLRVFELQSDWAQDRRKAETRVAKNVSEGRTSEADTHIDTANHPLLAHHQRLALKAAIEHARKRGIKRVVVDDAETAMMTEGHDKEAIANRTEDARTLVRRGRHNNVMDALEELKQTPPTILQEKGMRLAYDNVLQQHMRELAGDGVRVELGDHRNARGDKYTHDDGAQYDTEGPKYRPDLIFRNPDGMPKTQSTGFAYDVSAPQARRDAGEPFSYAGRKYQGSQSDDHVPHGFWIGRGGEMHPVRMYEHDTKAKELLAKLGTPYDSTKGVAEFQAEKAGFARAVFDRRTNTLFVDQRDALSNAARREIKNYAIEHGINAVYGADTSRSGSDVRAFIHDNDGSSLHALSMTRQRYQGSDTPPGETPQPTRDPVTGLPVEPWWRKLRQGLRDGTLGIPAQLEKSGIPSHAYAAGKIRSVMARQRRYAAEMNDPIQVALQRLNDNQKAHLREVMLVEDDSGIRAGSGLKGEMKTAYDTIRGVLRSSREQQIAMDHTLRDGTMPGFSDRYLPNVIRGDIARELYNKSGSPEWNRLRDEFIARNVKEFEGRGMTPDKALAEAEDAFKKFGGSSKAPTAEAMMKYGGADLPAHTKLPEHWIEADLSRMFDRYTQSFARSRAWHDVMDVDPQMRALNGFSEMRDGTPLPETLRAANPSLMGNQAYNQFREAYSRGGMSGSSEAVLPSTSRFVNSLLISGPRSKITDLLTTVFKAVPYVPPSRIPGLVANLAQYRQSYDNSFRNGLNNRSGQIVMHEVLGAGEHLSSWFDRAAEKVVKYSGSEALERVARGLAQNTGEYIIRVNKPLALEGDARALRLMDHLGDDWRTSTVEDLGGRMGRVFQGNYDVSNLPAWMFDSPAAPFLTMMKWNVEQWNNFRTFAWEPALKGDVAPLVYTMFSGILGGIGINEVRKLLAAKEDQNPTFAELQAATDSGAAATELMAKFAKYAQVTGTLGIVGEITSQAMDAANGRLPQGFKFPVAEFVADSAARGLSAVKAIADGVPVTDVLAAVTADMARAHVQMVQFADSMAAAAGVDTVGSATRFADADKRRNLRVFNRLNGYPQADPFTTFAPYSGLEERKLDKAKFPEAAELIQQLVAKAIKDSGGDRELLRSSLRKIRSASIPGMPSVDTSPRKFRQYLAWQGGQGRDVNALAGDYFQTRALRKAKSAMVPSL